MDIHLNVVERGTGFPLVLLHGNGEDHTYFERQMEPFARRWRVLAVETRGHGSSPRGTAPFTLEQFADDLRDCLEERGIRKCHLLGFSDGGNIAILFALKYPQYLDRLVLNGANLFPEGVVEEEQKVYEARWRELGALPVLTEAERREWELLDLMVTQPQIDPAALKALTMPVLVVAGEKDLIREDHTRLIAASIPGSVLRILPGDHFIARRNAESFNETVLAFLEGRDGPEAAL